MIADRITIDIDHYEPNANLKALKAYHALQRNAHVAETRVYVSSGGKGVHIEGLLTERLSDDERHSLRATLNDDSKRLSLDQERGAVGHATNIMWDTKDSNDGVRDEVSGIWAALDRIEANRASDHSRVKGIAQSGHKAVWDTHRLNRASLVDQ